MADRLIAPVDVQIELTQECNFNCFHCYNYWRSCAEKKASHNFLQSYELQRIIAELVINQVPSITITGGEPFLRKQELYLLLKLARENEISVSVNSNFSLVDFSDLEFLKEEYPDITLLVSLMSANSARHEFLTGAKKGSFEKIISNLEFSVSQGLHTSINMVLVRQNIQDLELTAQLAKTIGVNTFCATKALPNINASQNDFVLQANEVHSLLQRLVEIEESIGMPIDTLGCFPKCFLYGTDAYHHFSHRVCVAAITTATIGVDSAVRPCSHIEKNYGNIQQDSLADIWQKMSGWYKGDFIPRKCKNCQILELCRGSCRVNNLEQDLTAMDLYATPKQINGLTKEQLSPRFYEETGEIVEPVQINAKVKFRTETFGALLYRVDKGIITLVNQKAAGFLKNAAKAKRSFTFSEFLAESGVKNKQQKKSVEALYKKLCRKGVLVSRK